MKHLLPAISALLILSIASCSAPPSGVDLPALREARLIGITDTPIDLQGGVYENPAERTRIALVEDHILHGDFRGHGREDAAALVTQSSGGSGTFLWLVILESAPGRPQSAIAQLLGDRVQVLDFLGDKDILELELLVAGEDDPACCPTHKEKRRYRFLAGKLVETKEAQGQIGIDDMRGVRWVLESLSQVEGDTVAVEVDFTLEGSRFGGNGGCNRYFGEIRQGAGTALSLAPVASTMRRCPAEQSGVESLYFQRLKAVKRFGFLYGKLALEYEIDGQTDALVFRRGAAGE